MRWCCIALLLLAVLGAASATSRRSAEKRLFRRSSVATKAVCPTEDELFTELRTASKAMKAVKDAGQKRKTAYEEYTKESQKTKADARPLLQNLLKSKLAAANKEYLGALEASGDSKNSYVWFLQELTKEFNQENLLFIKDIWKWEDGKRDYPQFEKILAQVEATIVNLPADLKKSLDDLYEGAKAAHTVPPTAGADVFTAARKSIQKLVHLDPWSARINAKISGADAPMGRWFKCTQTNRG